MKVFFRVDASASMGIGHLMRCLTLAEALRERDVQIHFVCREHIGNLIALLQQKALEVTELPAPLINNTLHSDDYAHWLGVTQEIDAEQTIAALNCEDIDWLVVDHYGLDVEWEQRLRPHVGKLLVIDDLANRHHECDLLLDQNYSLEGEYRYRDLLPKYCKLLMGPRYALLRPEYSAYRKTLRTNDGLVRKVFVFFGGSDPDNMTCMALESLCYAELKHLEVDVIVGANNPHIENIKQQVLRRPLTNLHKSQPHLADLMILADLALGAGGITTWERMCLGLPTVLVTIAENQCPAAESLATNDLVIYAGDVSTITVDNLSKVIIGLVSNSNRVTELSENNQLIVDGLGVLRMREFMFPTDIDHIRLRTACQYDEETYFNWANDSDVRKNAIQTEKIDWAVHKKWFAKKLNDSNSHLYVLEAKGLPVGQIRFDKEINGTRIDYSLDALVRGRGWGARLVSLGMDTMQKIETIKILAEVKTSNKSSQSVFLRLGFTSTESKSGNLIFEHNT